MMKIYHDYRFTGTPPFSPMFQIVLEVMLVIVSSCSVIGSVYIV